MHKTFELAKVLKKGSGSEKDSNSMKTFIIVMGVIIALLLAALGVFMDKLGGKIGDPVMLFQELFLVGAVFSMFFTAPMIINTMYMSDDLTVLLTLPYTYNQIIWAKIINVSSLSWLASAVFSLPCGLAYGVTHTVSISFFLALILAAICVPVITLSFMGSIIILIMYFVHSLRNKDTMKILGAVFGFIILIGVVIASNLTNTDTDAVNKLIGAVGKFVNVLPVNFALKVLLSGSFDGLMLLAVVGITAGFFVIFALLAKFLYISGALSMQNTSSASMNLSGEAFARACEQKSVFRTFLKRDLQLVRRNPAFLMNGFLVPYIYPAVLLLIYMFSTNNFEFMSVTNIDSDIAALGWTTGVAILIGSVASCGNVIATTCMSREGSDIMVLKQLPVNYKDVLKAKQWTALLVSGGSCVLYDVVGGMVLAAMGLLPVWAIPYALILSFGVLYFCISSVMVPDIKKPSFTWESEADMIKGKTTASSIILMLVTIFLAMGLLIVIRFMPAEFFWPVLVCMVIVSALVVLISSKRLYRVGPEYMSRY